MPSPIQLAYVSNPQRHRRLRIVLKIFLFVLLGLLAYRFGLRGFSQLQTLYWQQRCASYLAPADEIVYAAIPPLLRTVDAWSAYAAAAGAGIKPYNATLFLHERTSPSGHRRLVMVEVSNTPLLLHDPVVMPNFRCFTIEKGFTPTRQVCDGYVHDRQAWLTIDSHATIFAGQIDTNDASHFTVRVQENGIDSTLDGWLRDDDQVLLERRSTKFP